jgi:hypothetical protein
MLVHRGEAEISLLTPWLLGTFAANIYRCEAFHQVAIAVRSAHRTVVRDE